LIIFGKSAKEIKDLLKSEKNYGYLKCRPVCTYDLIQYNFREKLSRKSKHTFYVQLFFPESRAVYEIMWKNIVEPDN
jgi:hypothetical protein